MTTLHESGVQLLTALRLLKEQHKTLQTQIETRIEQIKSTYVICTTPETFCALDATLASAVKQLSTSKEAARECDLDIQRVLLSMDALSSQISSNMH